MQLNKKAIIHGNTGQCRAILPILEYEGIEVIAIIDEFVEKNQWENLNIPMYKSFNEFARKRAYKHLNRGVVVAIGNPHGKRRQELYEFYEGKGFEPINVIHRTSIVENYVTLGKGVQVHAGVIIEPGSIVGDYAIINTGATVCHDNIICIGAEVGPGATTCGHVVVKPYAWVGAGSVVRQRQKIGSNSIVGCGSVVVSDIESNVVCVGNPARFLREI